MSYLVEQVLNGVSLGSIYGLIALGFAFVFGVLKLLNLAHSEVFAAAAYLAWAALGWLMSRSVGTPVMNVLLAAGVACVGAGLLAMLIERVAYRPLRSEPRIRTLLTAIGMSLLLQNLGIRFLSARTRGFAPVTLPVSPRVFAVMALLASLLVVLALLTGTKAGLRLRAVAEDPATSQLFGINPNRQVTLAFFIGGCLAGVAGLTWGLVYGTVNPQMGFHVGLKAFIIAVLGSIGRPTGTVLAGVALGIVESLAGAYLPSSVSSYRDPVTLSLLLAVMVWRPSGLLGARKTHRV